MKAGIAVRTCLAAKGPGPLYVAIYANMYKGCFAVAGALSFRIRSYPTILRKAR